MGETIAEAVQKAYNGAEAIHFEGAQYRKDIGWRAIQR
jgi:phosphoribosylamine--glycine ligase